MTEQERTNALKVVTSVIRKCQKARSKYEPDSRQYGRYDGTIRAMELARTLIENKLLRRAL